MDSISVPLQALVNMTSGKQDIDFEVLEEVFSELELCHPFTSDTPTVAFFNRQTGKVIKPASEQEIDQCLHSPNLFTFPKPKKDSLEAYEQVLNFIDQIEDGGTRITLDRLIKGRGAMRRFKDFLYTKEGEEIRENWLQFKRENLRVEIRDWVESLDTNSC